MSNAVVTGKTNLSSLEAHSTGSGPGKFHVPLTGALVLNGVSVSLRSNSVEAILKTINRFTPQSVVTASVTADKGKHLVLTSAEDMHVDGDSQVLSALGVTSGITKVSTFVAVAPTPAPTPPRPPVPAPAPPPIVPVPSFLTPASTV